MVFLISSFELIYVLLICFSILGFLVDLWFYLCPLIQMATGTTDQWLQPWSLSLQRGYLERLLSSNWIVSLRLYDMPQSGLG